MSASGLNDGSLLRPGVISHVLLLSCLWHQAGEIVCELTAVRVSQTPITLKQRCQTHFHRGPHQPHGCLQRAECNLGLYKCNYSLTVKQESALPPGRNKVLGWIKQGGGPDLACGPCVCQLFIKICIKPFKR